MDKIVLDNQPGVIATGITGALTLTKTGTTARTATFPDAAITVAGSASALTSGRVPYATTGGLLTDSAELGYSTGLILLGASAYNGTSALRLNATAGNLRGVQFQTAGVNRWLMYVNGTAESGANAGSDFALLARDDAGASIDTPLSILRAAGGLITLARPVTCTGVITVPNGTAAAPGLRTTTYAHGLFSKGSTSLGVSAAGVEALAMYAPGSGYGGSFNFNTPVAGDYSVVANNASNCLMILNGGFSTTASGQVRLYGSTHATKADRVEFTRGSTISAYFDGSGNLICNGTVTVPNGTAAAPGIRLTGEAHGLYRIGSASLGIACAGVATAQFAGAAASYSAAFTLKHTDASLPAWFTHDMADGYIVFGGPAATGLTGGGQTRLYGNTHATKADYVEFTRGATVSAFFNGSGVLTVNSTTDASAVGTAAIVGLGGASFAKSLWCAGSAGQYINIANSTGELRVNGTKVLTAQGAAVADAGAVSGTATLAGYGFVSAAEFNAAITAINTIKDQLNTYLARGRAHGFIAT